MLRDEDKKQIKNQLDQMDQAVQLINFTQQVAGTCMYCRETETLLTEVAELSPLLMLNVSNFVTDKELVDSYGIDKIPATVVRADKDAGVRFYGIPSGYEFASFLQLILMLSKGNSNLPETIVSELKTIVKPVHIQVFVTPTCPYCTRAAMTAFQFAIENDNIKSDVVEVTEFPHLAQKYNVMGVPRIVINEEHVIEGAVPEQVFLDKIKTAVSES